MKIVIYTHAFAPQVGGVQTFVMALARGLQGIRGDNRDVEVTVATAAPADGFDDRQLPFRVVRQPSLGAWRQLLRATDVLHLSGPALVPLALTWFSGKPAILEHHGFQAGCPNGQLVYEPALSPCPGHFLAGRHRECLRCNAALGWWQSVKLWLLTFPRRWLAKRMRAQVVPTSWLASVLRLENTTTIAHGVPGLSPPVSVPAQPPRFAYIGRLVSAKGVSVLLHAARELAQRSLEFRIRIIGDGPMRAALEAETTRLGLGERVAFLGHLPAVERERELSAATAVVLPSLGGEVFGLTAAENMMAGRLVIASDLGAYAEVVGDAGLTFPAGNAQSLAQRMQSVLADPARAAELRCRARQRAAERFQQERMVREHLALYRRLLPQGD